jgi:Proteasome subunit
MRWQQFLRGPQVSGLKACLVDCPSDTFHRILTASNGIVIATEKKSSSILIDDSMLDKVAIVCPNIGIVYSGMGPDFRVLIAKARKSAQAYWKIYGEYPPTRVLTQEIATVMQKATQSGYDFPCNHQTLFIRRLEVCGPMECHYLLLGGISTAVQLCIRWIRQGPFGRGKRVPSGRIWSMRKPF